MRRLFLLMLVSLCLCGVEQSQAAKLGLTEKQLMVGLEEYFPRMEWDRKPKCPYLAGTYRPDEFRLRARYLINPECSFSGEKIESPGITSVIMYVPIRREWSANEMIPYLTMLSQCLQNAVPEWKNIDEQHDWLTQSISTLVEGRDPKFSDLTNFKNLEKTIKKKKVRISLTGGIIELQIYAF